MSGSIFLFSFLQQHFCLYPTKMIIILYVCSHAQLWKALVWWQLAFYNRIHRMELMPWRLKLRIKEDNIGSRFSDRQMCNESWLEEEKYHDHSWNHLMIHMRPKCKLNAMDPHTESENDLFYLSEKYFYFYYVSLAAITSANLVRESTLSLQWRR